METLELKSPAIKIKTSVCGLISRMKGIEETISEQEGRIITIFPSKKQRESRSYKMSAASEIYPAPPKCLLRSFGIPEGNIRREV